MATEGIDFSEVDRLVADIGEVADTIGPYANSAVNFTSVKIKKAAAKSVGKSPTWGAAAQAIDYDIKVHQAFGVSTIQSEIGFDKEKTAGSLGNLREFGAPDSPNGPLAPHNDLAIALHANERDYVYGLQKATEDAERAAGL